MFCNLYVLNRNTGSQNSTLVVADDAVVLLYCFLNMFSSAVYLVCSQIRLQLYLVRLIWRLTTHFTFLSRASVLQQPDLVSDAFICLHKQKQLGRLHAEVTAPLKNTVSSALSRSTEDAPCSWFTVWLSPAFVWNWLCIDWISGWYWSSNISILLLFLKKALIVKTLTCCCV